MGCMPSPHALCELSCGPIGSLAVTQKARAMRGSRVSFTWGKLTIPRAACFDPVSEF